MIINNIFHGHSWLFMDIRVLLKPCFNGRWSLTLRSSSNWSGNMKSLNPCFNGRWSLTLEELDVQREMLAVLILVLMEDGLWHFLNDGKVQLCRRLNPCFNGRWALTGTDTSQWSILLSLNPCFNGRWSRDPAGANANSAMLIPRILLITRRIWICVIREIFAPFAFP